MKFNLQRIRPFEGLCLTVQDLLDEQTYHRQNLSLAHIFAYMVMGLYRD